MSFPYPYHFAILWHSQCRRTLRGPIKIVRRPWRRFRFHVPRTLNLQPSTLDAKRPSTRTRTGSWPDR